MSKIITDANYQSLGIDYLGSRILEGLKNNNIFSQLAANANLFTQQSGNYQPGGSIDIIQTEAGSSTVVQDVTTNPDISFSKSTQTRYQLQLKDLQYNNVDMNAVENAFMNRSETAINSIVTTYLNEFVDTMESTLFLDTFNDANIDANSFGATGTALSRSDLSALRKEFTKAKGTMGKKFVVLPPDMYQSLLNSFDDKLAPNTQSANERRYFISKQYGFEVYESNSLPTLTQLTNITGTSADPIGFAFHADSTALFNPPFDFARGVNTDGNYQLLNEDGFNLTIHETLDANKVAPVRRVIMRSLYGSIIYRPTLAFPILGGAS